MPRLLILVVVLAGAWAVGMPARAVDSVWAYRAANGRLIYVPDPQGDRIMDFSDVGYRGRGVELIPNDVPAVVTVPPAVGDDTANIQAAIDHVSSLPLQANGFRGAVQLSVGHYDIAGQLNINASGVVLRGVGREADSGTVLHARGTSQRPLINVNGSGSQSLVGSTRNMVDKTVPVGATSFRVDSTAGFAVGDTVRVERPSTADWINDIGMNAIPPNPNGTTIQWQPGAFNIRFDRVITRIEGDRIFLDAPLANSFELKYGGGTIRRYSWNGRIENVGIENMRAESDFASATDEAHSWDFVSIDAAQNVWVRQTTSAYFAGSAVVANPGAKWVAVQDAVNLDPKSQVTGERRYTFDFSGQLEFLTDSVANSGRHDFVNNSSRPAGPHVFHRSIAYNALADSGPHQRWATGSLFDNIVVQGNQINARNRGNFGTGHGWSGANMVVWNSQAQSFIIQNPPTAQNWLIGSTGSLVNDTAFGQQPPGYVDSHNQRVAIDSLYEAQVDDAADIRVVHWAAADGAWGDAASWRDGLAPAVYSVMHRDYLIGDIDDFFHDGPSSVDNAPVDPAWGTYVASSTGMPITGFDDTSGTKNVAFTIQHQVDPGERIIHGTLAMSLKQGPGAAADDFVRLFDADPSHLQSFASLGWSAKVNSTTPFVGVLDLSGEFDSLQSGAVNVQVHGDTGVDWAIYQVAAAKTIGDASGAAVYVANGGVARIADNVGTVGALVLGSDDDGGTLALAANGRIAVAGPMVQNDGGGLGFQLGNAGAAGRIDVAEAAALDGMVSVALDSSYAPTPGDRFTLLTAASLAVDLAGAALPPSTPDAIWALSADAQSLVVELFHSADFNLDRVVDGQDLAFLSMNVGAMSAGHAEGDANGDGLVDGADVVLWQRQLGRSSNSLSFHAASAIIPEPATGALMATALATAGSARSLLQRRRARRGDRFPGVMGRREPLMFANSR